MSKETNSQIGSAMQEQGKIEGLRRTRPCPVCAKPSVKASYPFCSPRCKDVDLSRWLSGSYAIPAVEEDEPDEADYQQ